MSSHIWRHEQPPCERQPCFHRHALTMYKIWPVAASTYTGVCTTCAAEQASHRASGHSTVAGC